MLMTRLLSDPFHTRPRNICADASKSSNPICTERHLKCTVSPSIPSRRLPLQLPLAKAEFPRSIARPQLSTALKVRHSGPALLSHCAPFTCPHDSCDHVTSFLNLSGSMSVWGGFSRHRILKCHFVMRGLCTTSQL